MKQGLILPLLPNSGGQMNMGVTMKTITVSAGVLLAAVAMPAAAQESEDDWTGPLIGVVGGYESITFDLDEDDFGPDAGDESDDGALYGIVAGFDFDSGSAVFGIEAELTGSQVEESAFDVLVVGDEVKLEAGRDLYIGGRAGFKASDTLLVYGKAGYTNAKAILSYDDGIDEFSESDTIDGFRVGAGIELRFKGGARFRGEYRYSDYGEYTYEGIDSGVSLSKNQVVAGFAYDF